MRPSVPSRIRLPGALGSFVLVTLVWSGAAPAGGADALTMVTSETALTNAAVLAPGCNAGDFNAPEDFEGLVGGDIVASPQFSFALGFPPALFPFPSGIILAGPDPIGLEHFPKRVSRPAPARAGTVPLHDRRRAHIAQMLRKHQGNVSAVARDMGKARMQIQRWIKRYELDPDRHR